MRHSPLRPGPLRPGDVIRLRRGIPLSRVDDTLDFLRVHYDTHAPGLARVLEETEDGLLLSLWGHRFRTTEPAASPRLRALGRFALWVAPERLGEAILAREVRNGRVVMDPPPRTPRQRLVRLWLRRTRGPLPLLEALGGRVRPPVLRWLKSALFRRLATHGLMPPAPGFLNHGVLIDRIGRTVMLGYGHDERTVWLDRILLHRNHALHLVGIDLDKGEQRTFRLDRIWAMEIPTLGEIDPYDLWLELGTLTTTRESWLWSWNKRQAELGLPPGPAIGPVGRTLSALGKALSWLMRDPPSRPGQVWAAWDGRRRDLLRRIRHQIRYRYHRVHALCWSIRPPAFRRKVRTACRSTAWRDRLLRAIAAVEAGGTDQVTCLLPMNALLADPFAGHAWLRHMLERTLADAKADGTGHPLAVQLVTETLTLVTGTPGPPSRRRSEVARALHARLVEAQPGHRRLRVHATRRTGGDSRLLLCESCLEAVYGISGRWCSPQLSKWPAAPRTWAFYRANAYYVARWEDCRFRVDASAAVKLKDIKEWWDSREGS